MNLDEEIKKIDATLGDRVPIDEEWLHVNRFQLCGRHEGQEKNRSVFLTAYYLDIDPQIMPNIQYGLSLEVCPSFEDRWHCWLVQDDPRRSIHIRMVEYRDEIKHLVEALVGCRWEPKDA